MGRRIVRRLVIASDIEMGAGGVTDDCPRAGLIATRFLEHARRHRGEAIDFIFNGDTFDFLKTAVGDAHPVHVTEAIALAKLSRIARAHPDFFEGVRALLASGEHRVHFIVGNHDFELLFPAVQAGIRALVGDAERVHFPGMSLDIGDVHVEHGSQGDGMFAIDPAAPFIEHLGDKVLNLPWGAVAVMEVLLPYHGELYHLDRVKPKSVLFGALPEARALLMERSRLYWSSEFWRAAVLEGDPLKRPSWPMLKEVVKRMRAQDAEVSFGEHYLEALRRDDERRVFAVAHEHRPRILTEDDKTLLETGCIRDEYRLDPETWAQTPWGKGIGEIILIDGVAVDAMLLSLEWPAPERPPPDLRALRPLIAERLAELRDARERADETPAQLELDELSPRAPRSAAQGG